VSEGREIALARMEELSGLTADELLRYEADPTEEEVAAASGRRYRVALSAFDDHEDGPIAKVRVRGTGLRAFQRWTGRVHKPHKEYPEEMRREMEARRDVTTRTQDYLEAALVIAIVLLLVAPWFIGVGFLISLLF
jgi:PAS domain-containing protein